MDKDSQFAIVGVVILILLLAVWIWCLYQQLIFYYAKIKRLQTWPRDAVLEATNIILDANIDIDEKRAASIAQVLLDAGWQPPLILQIQHAQNEAGPLTEPNS